MRCKDTNRLSLFAPCMRICNSESAIACIRTFSRCQNPKDQARDVEFPAIRSFPCPNAFANKIENNNNFLPLRVTAGVLFVSERLKSTRFFAIPCRSVQSSPSHSATNIPASAFLSFFSPKPGLPY
jgi:hypothetical protein